MRGAGRKLVENFYNRKYIFAYNFLFDNIL